MLHREVDGGYIAITQPAHAWVSGQIASAWGNELVGEVHPRHDVVLAAEQHDIGWLEWEAEPALNPDTGRPRTFMELPTFDHLSVWAPAGPRSLVYGPYVAMLVSMHGTGLYGFHDFSRDTVEEAAAARAFMERGARFEADMRARAATDAALSPWCDDETIARNRRLVAVWDAMSLFLCGGLRRSREMDNVPATVGAISITMTPDPSNYDNVTISPWPFAQPTVELATMGRMMTGTCTSEADLHDALRQAEWARITITLQAG